MLRHVFSLRCYAGLFADEPVARSNMPLYLEDPVLKQLVLGYTEKGRDSASSVAFKATLGCVSTGPLGHSPGGDGLQSLIIPVGLLSVARIILPTIARIDRCSVSGFTPSTSLPKS